MNLKPLKTLKPRAESALQTFGRGLNKLAKDAVAKRIDQQKRFENRPNNANYYKFK